MAGGLSGGKLVCSWYYSMKNGIIHMRDAALARRFRSELCTSPTVLSAAR